MTLAGGAAAYENPARPRMRPLVLIAALLLTGCHADRLRPTGDGGFEIRSRATAQQVRDLALDVARELDHPARLRDGAVEVELASAPPMSERPSQRLRVTVTGRGTGTATVVQPLPQISVPPRPRRHGQRPPVGTDAYTYADLLADRLADVE